MANYYRTYKFKESGRVADTNVTLYLSDDYDALLEPTTSYNQVKNLEINGVKESIEGQTYNVHTANVPIILRSDLLYNDCQSDNEALVNEIIAMVNNGTDFFGRIVIDSEQLFIGKFSRYTFKQKSSVTSSTNYTTALDNFDIEIEIEELGLNLSKEIEVLDILTDSMRDALISSGDVAYKQGAYHNSTYDSNINTGYLIALNTFFEKTLEGLVTYINTNFPVNLTGYVYDADCNIGEATPYAMNLSYRNDIDEYWPYVRYYDGAVVKSWPLTANKQTLKLDSTNEEELIYIPANSVFTVEKIESSLRESWPNIGLQFDNNEADSYRIRTSFKYIYDLFDFIIENLSLTFKLYIDGTTLRLEITNNDETSAQPIIYTDKILQYDIEIKEPETTEEEETEFDALTNAYSYERETIYDAVNAELIQPSGKPLLLTLGGSYLMYRQLVNQNFSQIRGGTDYTTRLIQSYVTPSTTIFMKVAGYDNTGDNPAFASYRPTNFWAPVGNLSYRVNADTNKNFRSMLQRVNYFQDRYLGADNDNPLQVATIKIAGISNFSDSDIGTSPSADILRVGKKLVIDGKEWFITEIERDLNAITTTIKAIASDFFGQLTPTSDAEQSGTTGSTVIITESGGGSESSGEASVSGTIDVFDLVAYNDDGLLELTENTVEFYNRIAGFSVSQYTNSEGNDIITVQQSGYVTNSDWSFTPGQIVYAESDGSIITLTQTEPTPDSNNEMLIVVGTAITTDTINLAINTYIYI